MRPSLAFLCSVSVATALGVADASIPASRQGHTRSPDVPFEQVQPALHQIANTYSNAWGDFDGDGNLDLALSTGAHGIRLFRNDHGTLVSVGRELGLPDVGYELRGVSWADYDDDGFPDLLAGPIANDKLTLLFHNDAGRHFTEVGPTLGLTMPGRSSRQTNFVDFDNDGDLDVYATDRSSRPNQVYRNDRGRFARVFEGTGPSDTRPSVGACWFDVDRDGDLDLFLANQAGAADALWRNDITSFTDLAPKLGLTGPTRASDQGGVGCAIADYDNDGDFDIFVPNYGRNQLYRNNGDGTFTDVAHEVGVDADNHAVSADWGDYDNDGDLDLSIMAYVGAPGAQVPKDMLFRNEGAAGFVNMITAESPLNRGDHGTQFVDYDNDGGLDLSITNGYSKVGGHFLFRNILPESAKRRSLSVLVVSAGGHQTQFGAEVRLRNSQSRILASRLVAAGGGYNSQRVAPVHFGVSSLEPVTVEVTFMSKSGPKVQTVKGVKPAEYYSKSLVVRRAP